MSWSIGGLTVPQKKSAAFYTPLVYIKAFGLFVSQGVVGNLKSGAITQESSGAGNLKVTLYLRCTHAILCRLDHSQYCCNQLRFL